MTDPFSSSDLLARWVQELNSESPDLSLIASIEQVAEQRGWSIRQHAADTVLAGGCKPKRAKKGRKVLVLASGERHRGQIISFMNNPADEDDPYVAIIAGGGCSCGSGCGGSCAKYDLVVPESSLSDYDEDGYDYSYSYDVPQPKMHGDYEKTPRQKMHYKALEKVEEVFGKWDQTSGADGAHYMPVSPFVHEGLVCANCCFYEGPRGCEIVEGDIDPAGICKLWVIPETLVSIEGTHSEHDEHDEHGEYGYEMLDDDQIIVLSSAHTLLATRSPAERSDNAS